MKYQFCIDGRGAGPVREEWHEAADDAVRDGFASWIGKMWSYDGRRIKMHEQATIERYNKRPLGDADA